MTLQPPKANDQRVVSDMSRFDFDSLTPRNRSRNTTPTSTDHHPEHNEFHPSEFTEPYNAADIYSDYLNTSMASVAVDHTAPYPLSGTNSSRILAIPRTPAGNSNDTLTDIHDHRNKDLPPITEPRDYYRLSKGPVFATDSDMLSTGSRKKELGERLVKQVMNQPMVTIAANRFVGSGPDHNSDYNIVITWNFLLYVVEIICETILIILSSVMLLQDTDTPKAIYRYFIADASISMIVSLLFVFHIINFEKRNGSFYCLAACLITVVSFILSVSQLVAKPCHSSGICNTRRTITAFIIISTFLWVGNLVMFLTTLYISKLNMLDDINFDYQEVDSLAKIPAMPEPEEHGLKKFILTEKGDMYPVQNQMEVQGRNKILVYTF